MKYQIINGNNIDVLKTFPDNHFDSIVTDPPYGIDFLGKAWDANTGAVETYQECLRVLKPGGHILAFSAARTYHHLAVTLEQAGFEIRDQIMWIYSSGFPKSQDIGKSIQRSMGVKETKKVLDNGRARMANKLAETNNTRDAGFSGQTTICTDPEAQAWAGWGTALKPAHEPIALARKPIKTSIKDNVLKHGVGALNIDATRIPTDELKPSKMGSTAHANYNAEKNSDQGLTQGENLDWIPAEGGRFPANVIGEIADEYQKYFYCPKVSRKERHIEEQVDNNHPTVKPIELMKYLIKLVTPPNGIVLDPFNGSGSTGCAAVELGFEYVGIELDPKYVEIATKRIEAWNKEDTSFSELFE